MFLRYPVLPLPLLLDACAGQAGDAAAQVVQIPPDVRSDLARRWFAADGGIG